MDEHDTERQPDMEPRPGTELPTDTSSAAEKTAGFTVTDRRFWAQPDDGSGQPEQDRERLPTYVEQLKSQLEDKDRQLREYIAAYKREVVEGLDKTKQRLERDAARERERERGELARPMMEVLDALELSLSAAESAKDVGAIVQGLHQLHMLMVQKLQELGLTRIATSGQPFDPLLHEAAAVLSVSDPGLDGQVTTELRPGFRLGDKVVRPALVQVGKLQAGS